MSVPLHTIQIEQALFETRNAVVGKRRALDRLVAGLIVGGPIALAGPKGVGKSHMINVIARVFGLEVTNVDNPADVADLERCRLGVIDSDAVGSGHVLADPVGASPAAQVVLTTSTTDPSKLPSDLRDALLSFVEIPYPTAAEETAMALGPMHPGSTDRILHDGDLAAIRSHALGLQISDSVVGYAVRLVQASRLPTQHGLANLAPLLRSGASPRASIGLVRAARGLAVIAGRSEVTPQDVYDAAFEVMVHRIELTPRALELAVSPADIVVELLSRLSATT